LFATISAKPIRANTYDLKLQSDCGSRQHTLQPRIQESGDHKTHDQHEGHSSKMFRDKFWLSFALTLPVVFWSAHVQELLGYRAPELPGSTWIPPVLGTAVFVYGGLVFLKGAWRELRSRLPGMMTLISLAIAVAFIFSWVVQLGLIQANALWWELSTLVTIMLLGHWIEMRSISQAQGALQELAKLLPDTATRVTDQGEETVPVSALREGDIVLVRPGESVPADGVVRQGASALNEAMLTGESRPVKKQEGDEVIAATINGEGSLRVEITGTGDKTKLSGIMRLVSDAQKSKSRAQHLADRAARILTGVAIVAGVLTLAMPLPWPPPTSGLRLARVPTLRWKPDISCSCAPTRVTFPGSLSSPAPPTGRCFRTCGGRQATTSSPFPWQRACSRRGVFFSPRRWARC
jgi:Cu2+-exporting ATPase